MALTSRIELIANEAGFLAFVLSSDGKAEIEDRAIRTFKSMNVAGAIIAPLGVKSHRATLEQLAASIPIVYVDSPLDETSAFVGTDNRQSVGLMVDYLCRSGEPPCFFDMPQVNTNAATRRTAYEEAMRRLGFEPHVIGVPGTVTSISSVSPLMKRLGCWMGQGICPRALFYAPMTVSPSASSPPPSRRASGSAMARITISG